MRRMVWGAALAWFFVWAAAVTAEEAATPAASRTQDLSALQTTNEELRDAYLETAAVAAKTDAEGLQLQEQTLERLFNEIRRLKGMEPGEKVVLPPGIENLDDRSQMLTGLLASTVVTAARVQKEIQAEKARILRRDKLRTQGIQAAFSKHQKDLTAGKAVTETEMRNNYEAAILAAESEPSRAAASGQRVGVIVANRTDAPIVVRIWKVGETAGWNPKKALTVRVSPLEVMSLSLARGQYSVRCTLPKSPTPNQVVADVVLTVEKPVMWSFLKAVPQFEVRVQEVKGSR